MEQSTAQRRLVKSPPELWAEVSSADTLGRRLAEFGEIRITRAVPETTVAWEGDRASGTVELEPAARPLRGAIPAPPAPAPDPRPPTPGPDPGPPAPEPDPSPPDPAPAPTGPQPLPPAPSPDPMPPPIGDPGPQLPPAASRLDPARTAAILTDVLDELGSAQHRPFSRD